VFATGGNYEIAVSVITEATDLKTYERHRDNIRDSKNFISAFHTQTVCDSHAVHGEAFFKLKQAYKFHQNFQNTMIHF
jgi:hypothetical protein